eukprot:1151738-Pelagomonas_calceolata.AAC.1
MSIGARPGVPEHHVIEVNGAKLLFLKSALLHTKSALSCQKHLPGYTSNYTNTGGYNGGKLKG